MLRRIALVLALASNAGCLAVERWPEIEPPYTPASIEGGRTLYVRPKGKTPVTLQKAVWEVEDGRAWITGEVHDEPDGILGLPSRFFHEVMLAPDEPWWRPGRIAVDEIQKLRMEPVRETGPNDTAYAVLLCLGIVVLVIALA